MEIHLSIIKANGDKGDKRDLDYFTRFLASKNITGLNQLEVPHISPKPGEQGGGWADFIKGIITGLTAPLTKLAEAVVEHVKNKKTTVTIKIGQAEVSVNTTKVAEMGSALEPLIAQLTEAVKALPSAETTKQPKEKALQDKATSDKAADNS